MLTLFVQHTWICFLNKLSLDSNVLLLSQKCHYETYFEILMIN
jgi:hypothetical protein